MSFFDKINDGVIVTVVTVIIVTLLFHKPAILPEKTETQGRKLDIIILYYAIRQQKTYKNMQHKVRSIGQLDAIDMRYSQIFAGGNISQIML